MRKTAVVEVYGPEVGAHGRDGKAARVGYSQAA